MSTFLTPPVWYDKNGNLNKMLAGFEKMSTDGRVVSISSPGVYLCCLSNSSTYPFKSYVAIFFIADLNWDAPALSSSNSGACLYYPYGSGEAELHEIQAGQGYTIDYCFKIIDTSL